MKYLGCTYQSKFFVTDLKFKQGWPFVKANHVQHVQGWEPSPAPRAARAQETFHPRVEEAHPARSWKGPPEGFLGRGATPSATE